MSVPASDRLVDAKDNHPASSDTQDLIRFKVAVGNALRNEDLTALGKLAEIALLFMMGKAGAHPSMATMASILGLKDERSVRRVMSSLEDGRWDREDVPGKGAVRVPSRKLEIEITAAIKEWRRGEFRMGARRTIRVPLAEVYDLQSFSGEPPTSDAGGTSNAPPQKGKNGGLSAENTLENKAFSDEPPTSHAPPTSDAGGQGRNQAVPDEVPSRRKTTVSAVQPSEKKAKSDKPPASDAPPASNAPLTVIREVRENSSSTSASSLEIAREKWAAGGDLFDDSTPGVHVRGEAVYVRYLDGKEIAVLRSSIYATAKALGITRQAEAMDLAIQALGGWVTDGWKPERPSTALGVSIRSVIAARERLRAAPPMKIPSTEGLSSISDGGWED